MDHRDTPEYSPEERQTLLTIAHQSIRSAVMDTAPAQVSLEGHLAEPRGVFVSLYAHSDLRGCIGYVEGVRPLYMAVQEMAQAAALEDPRFNPVNEAELLDLKVEISVMSLLFPIQPEEVEVGRHGLLVSYGGRRGLLLPQVPLEWAWDRETFLSQTCRKAGLPSDQWQRGATIHAFTAEVFGDEGAEAGLIQ